MSCLANACILFISATQTIGSGPARVILLPSGEGFTVIYENHIVSGLYLEKWTVDADGVAVSGVIVQRDGDGPDTLVVTPPLGFWCDPCEVTVNEDESGSVELYPEIGA